MATSTSFYMKNLSQYLSLKFGILTPRTSRESDKSKKETWLSTLLTQTKHGFSWTLCILFSNDGNVLVFNNS